MNDPETKSAPTVTQRLMKIGLLRRPSVALLLSRPDLVKPYLRYIFRKRIGFRLDRRLRGGYAAPPARIQLQLTRRCNLRCEMCITSRHSPSRESAIPWQDPKNELPLEAWTSFLAQTTRFRPWVNLSGGEPLLSPVFRGVVEAASKMKLPLEINTNGTFLARHARFLVDNSVGSLSVSIDGTEEVHDRIRGQEGLFRRTSEGVNALVKARIEARRLDPFIQIACTITKSNVHVLDKMPQLAFELGADILLFQHSDFNTAPNIELHNRALDTEAARRNGLMVYQPSIQDDEYYMSKIGREDMPLLRSALAKAKQQADGKIQFFMSPDLGMDGIEAYYLDICHPHSQDCLALWTTMRIMPDGTFSPCFHLAAGNIAEQGINEIWNGPVIRNMRRIITPRLLPGCARCCHRRF